MKEDVCYDCRELKRHAHDKSEVVTRKQTDQKAIVEQSMTVDEAEFLYNDAIARLLVDDKDEEAWYDKRRAYARLNREDIALA